MTAAPLVRAIARLPQDWFAVVDGAYFDNLSLVLQTYDLTGLPLYLEGGAPEHRDAAGFLVDLPDEAAIHRLMDLLAGRPAAVFWSWPLGRMALYRHLRTLNLVEIPNEAKANAQAEGAAGADDMPAFETVLFRHWDPNVLGGLLPLLSLPQRARFLDAATGLAFDAPDYAGLMAAPRPAGLPPAPHGYLRFSAEQMEEVDAGRLQASDERIAGYLRNNVPPTVLARYGDDLTDLIHQERARGRSLGLETERDLARWAYLQTMSGRRLHEQDAVRTLLSGPGMSGTVSERLERLFRDISVRISRIT